MSHWSHCHAVTLPVVTLGWSLTVAAPVTLGPAFPAPAPLPLSTCCCWLWLHRRTECDWCSAARDVTRQQAARASHWSVSQPHWSLIGPDKSNSLHTCYRICANLCTFLMAHENKYQLYGRFYQQININQIRTKCHLVPIKVEILTARGICILCL